MTALQRIPIILALLVLAACGDSGGGRGAVEPVAGQCDATSVSEDGVCRTFAERLVTQAATPFVENGEAVFLEVVLYRPLSPGRHPTVMFNHGSTGNGSDPALFRETFTHKLLAQYFVDRGWMVAFPQRRGRGQSGGLYDEGFRPDRSGYSCEFAIAVAGADRALEDLDAAVDWLRGREDVDTTRMLVAGTSRGGILSVVHAARRPDLYLGAINFVGGWIAEGCGDHAAINRTLFLRAAAWPGESLWLYGQNDSFYSVSYSRGHFDAFTAAGGIGTFLDFRRASGLNGHFLLNDPSLWGSAVDAILGTR